MVVQLRSPWRRFLGVALVAGVIGGICHQVMYPNPCKGLTPSDASYWAYSCWAQAPAAPMFIVR
jgi:hypothetical protein